MMGGMTGFLKALARTTSTMTKALLPSEPVDLENSDISVFVLASAESVVALGINNIVTFKQLNKNIFLSSQSYLLDF